MNEAAREIEEMKSQAIGSFGRKEANEAYCQRVLKHMVKDKDNLEAEHQHLLKIKSILGSEDAGLKRYILSVYIHKTMGKSVKNG